MLKPNDFKKKAIAKRLASPSRNKDKFTSNAQKVNDKQISDLIKRQTAPPPNKPAYKAPASKPLSTKIGPHNVFNPNAKIDRSQVEDRTQSDAMDKFVNRLSKNKYQQMRHPGSKYPVPKKSTTTMGTKNKEALLKRLREKGSA